MQGDDDTAGGRGGIVRKLSNAELVLSNARLRVLSEASHAFAVVVTDYEELLQCIAGMTAEVIGDGCMVTLLDADGEQMRNVASAHRDPSLAADYRAFLQGMGVSKASSTSVSAEVVRSGEPKLVTEVDPSVLVASTDASLKPLVQRLNVHSFVVVPIRVHDRTIGTLSVQRSRPGYSYTPNDMMLLQDLADRAGLAIETARLYNDMERRVRQRTAELENVNQELEAFSYSVAHDLRAPLRSIDGFSQALLEDCADLLDANGRAHLERVRGAAQHMAELIDALLNLSRLTRVVLHREPVDLGHCAEVAFSRCQRAEPNRSVQFMVGEHLFANADAKLLDIVLTNLIENAWKFTCKTSQAIIEVGAKAGSSPTEYFVRDNGAGFNPAYADKLFGAFQRLHSVQEFPGIGIGLATVQRIINRHGGRIWAQSEVDRGATFWFTLG